MSTQIDERIVAMKFDARDFDNNVRGTMSLLEKFKEDLKFSGVDKSFKDLGDAADKVSLKNLEDSASAVEAKFSTMSIVAISAINNIVNTAMNAGKQIVKSLTIDQVTAGFTKYEDKVKAVQTIMNATGLSIDEVSNELARLSWFTDETSYSFTDMVSNIGKFTSNNVPLQQSVTAMQGIANWAALSGQGVNEASRAMYNLSQAIAVGSVKLIDWKSIENANMATTEFKQTALDTAVALGTLVKQGDIYKGVYKDFSVSVTDFNSNLSEGWFTSDVLLATLNKYGEYADAVFQRVEETGETCATAMTHVSDEMMVLGSKAFRAAQEAKTFTDAIEATKDAVSTGWMNTFELIFGNYEEAKAMWTDLANELYDIFASGGEERNAMLESWVEMGGRVQLLATIKQAYSALLSVIVPVKEALREMFPPTTAKQLALMVASIKGVFNQLKLSEDAAYTLKVAVKALLVPFRLLFDGLEVGIVIIQELIKYIAKLGKAFLEMWSQGNPVEDFFRNLFGDERYIRLMEAMALIAEHIGNAFSYIGKQIGVVISKFKSSTKFTESWQKLVDILTPIAETVLDAIVEGMEMLAKLDFNDLDDLGKNTLEIIRSKLSGIFDLIVSIGSTVGGWFGFAEGLRVPLENIQTLQTSFKGLDTTITNFKDGFSFATILGSTNTLAEKLSTVIGSLTDSFGRLTERLSPAKILLFGFGTALTGMIFSAMKAFDSIKTMTDGVSTVIKNFGERLKPNKIAQIGKALLVLAGALVVLSLIDANRLAQATISMAALAGILLALSVGLAAIDKYLVSDKNNLSSISSSMVKISAALLILSAGLKVLNDVQTEGLGKKLAAILGIIIALGTVATLMSKFANNDLSKNALFMVAYAFAIGTMVNALKKLEQLDASRLLGSMGSLITLMGLLGVMSATIKDVKFGGALGVTLMIGNLFLLVEALKKISDIPLGTIINALPVYIGIVGLLSVLMKTTQSAGANAAKAGVFIIALSGAMIILGEAIKNIGSLDLKTAVQGGVVVSVLLGIFTGLTAVTKLVGQNTDKISKAIVMMSISLMLLGVCISYLGNLDLKVAVQGGTVVAAMLGIFALIMKMNQVILKDKEKLAGGAGALLAMTALVGVMASALAMLTLLPSEEVQNAAVSLGLAMLSVGVAIKLMGEMKFSGALKTAASLLVLMGVISGIMALIAGINTDETIIAKATAMGIMLIALATAVRIIPQLGTSIGKDGYIVIAELSAVMLALAGVLLILKDIDPLSALGNALALTVLLEGLVVSLKLLPSFAKTNMKTSTVALVEFMAFIVILAELLMNMDNLNPINSIANAAALSVLILALSGATKILSGFRKQQLGPVSVVLWELVGIMYILSLVLGLMNDLDPLNSVASSVSLGILLTALTASTMLLSGFKSVDKSVIVVMGTLVAALGLVALIIKGIEVLDIDINLPMVLMLSTLLIALSGAARILSGFKGADPVGVLGVLLAIEAALAVLIGIIWTVGQIPWDKAEESIKGFGTVGAALGEFIGQFVSHLISAGLSFLPQLGTYLSQFVENTFGFVEGIKKIDNSVLTGAATLAGAILLLTTAEVVQGIASFLPGRSKGSPLVSFGQQLADFGPYMAKFADSVSGIDAAQVSGISNAVKALSEAYFYLNDGILDGIADAIFGENNLATFGKELADFGPYFAEFARSLEGVPQEALDSTIAAAKCMAALEEGLPKHGGWVQSIFGDADLGTFGKNLFQFGNAIKRYSDIITAGDGIDVDAVEASASAGTFLAKLENSLRGHEGLFQSIFGEANLTDFGIDIVAFAGAIRAYSDELKRGDGVDYDKIEESTVAGKSLSELESGLKGSNGTWQSIFGGNQDLGTFSINLVSFGRALKNYSDSIQGIDFDRLAASAGVGEMLSALEAGLPDDGGIFGWFDGVQDFSSFGEGLKSLGEAMSQYNNSILSVDLEKVENSIIEFERITQLGARMNQTPTDGMKNFVSAMKKLGSTSINEFTYAFAQGEETMLNTINGVMTSLANKITTSTDMAVVGSSMIEVIINGIIQNESKVTIRGQDIVGFLLMGMSSQHDDLTSQGIYLITVICNAIDSQTGELKESIHGAIYTAIWNVQNSTEILRQAKLIGSNVIKGIIGGLDSESGRLNKAVTSMAQSMITTTMKVLDEHSPSVVFNKIAGNVVKGMVEGIEQNEDELNETMTTMNKDIIEQSENDFKIRDGISEVMRDRVGTFLIKGLAEGITTDMSAEEAAEKKASNIVNAFAESLETHSRMINIGNAEYNLWEAIFGDNATDKEKLDRQTEMYEANLKEQGEIVMEQQAAYEALINQFGKDSKEAGEAYLDYLDAYQSFVDMGKEYLELINTNNTTTRESMMEAAQAYNQYMQEIAPKLREMGFSEDDIMADARKQSNFNPNITIDKSVENDIQTLISKYIGYADTEIDAATAVIQASTETAVSTGVSSGVSRAASSNVASGGVVANNIATGIDESGSITGAIQNAIEEAAGKDYSGTFAGQANNMIDGFVSGLDTKKESAINAIRGIFSGGNTAAADEIDAHSPARVYVEFGHNIVDGLIIGLTDRKDAAIDALVSIFAAAIDETSSETNSISDIGRLMAEKIVEGLHQTTNDIPESIKNVMSTTINTVTNYNSEFYQVGYQLADSIIDGLIDGVRNRQLEAINEVVQLATEMYQAAVEALSVGSTAGMSMTVSGVGGAGGALGSSSPTIFSDAQRAKLAELEQAVKSGAISSDDFWAQKLEIIGDKAITLTPVIDTSSIDKQLSQIQATTSTAQASAISAAMNDRTTNTNNQNGIPGTTNAGTTYNFYQTNNSPAALSRIDIYRDTRNLLSSAKGVT